MGTETKHDVGTFNQFFWSLFNFYFVEMEII